MSESGGSSYELRLRFLFIMDETLALAVLIQAYSDVISDVAEVISLFYSGVFFYCSVKLACKQREIFLVFLMNKSYSWGMHEKKILHSLHCVYKTLKEQKLNNTLC